MNVMEAIHARRSVRAYTDRPVSRTVLSEIMEAGRLAPSAKNLQDWRFIAVTDRAKLRALAKSMPQEHGGQCTAVIVACGKCEESRMKCNQPRPAVDLSIATAFMHLRATELGVGTCWMGHFDAEVVRTVLGIPEDMCAVTLTTLGYPAEMPAARPRRSREEVTAFESYTGE
ncbi:MAG: nitroreductase family protein [Eubacteriales bacterium]|nr:nitroreductase family protein [Eubacteriales bacterium]